MAFLKQRPELAVAVLTDHHQEFANKFYHSLYDDSRNIMRSGSASCSSPCLSGFAVHASERISN